MCTTLETARGSAFTKRIKASCFQSDISILQSLDSFSLMQQNNLAETVDSTDHLLTGAAYMSSAKVANQIYIKKTRIQLLLGLL